MSKFKRYERYKDSGVEWIGEIPEEWRVSKLKYLIYCLDGKRIPLSSEQRGQMQGDIPYWGANCIIDYVNDWIIDGEIILLGEDGAPFFDKNKDVAFYSNEKIWPNNHVHVLRALHSVNAKFLTYILNTVDYRNYINGSTRDKLTQSEMKNIFIQLPSAKEQTAIANFLNQKTAEIDGLIADKEKLIELLQEKRQAVITEAVTKGLNPNVRLKDSGIEWIGEIPEHWGVSKIKLLLKVKDGTHDTPDFVDKGEGTVPLITSKNIIDGEIDFLNAKHISREDYININRRSDVGKNDIIMPMIGTIGNPVIVKTDKEFSIKNVALFKTSYNELLAKFIYYTLQSNLIKIQFDLLNRGGVQAFVSLDVLRNLLVIKMPSTELKEIVLYLENKTQEIDSLILSIRVGINKLKEYRQSLISEAVTGKIDVRDYVVSN